MYGDDLDDLDEVNLEGLDNPLREWIAQGVSRNEIQRKFRKFLFGFCKAEEFAVLDDDALTPELEDDERMRLKQRKAQTLPTY